MSVEENAVLVSFEVHVGTPKTHRSRSVPYPEFLALPLAQLAGGKRRDQLLLGDGSEHIKLPVSRNGWVHGRSARGAERRSDIPQGHTARPATRCREPRRAGRAHVKAVQRMLGHASAAMKLDVYAELFEDDLDAVATALDQAKRAANVVIPLSRERDRKA